MDPTYSYDSSYFQNGFPSGLNGNPAFHYDATTAARACQIANAVDAAAANAPADPTVTVAGSPSASDFSAPSENDTSLFNGIAWDVLEAGQHYDIVKGSDASHYLTALQCISTSPPVLSFNIDRAHITLGQSAVLSWNANTVYADAKESCEPISVSPEYVGYTQPTADAEFVGSMAVSPPANGTYTYTFACTNVNGTSTKTASLRVSSECVVGYKNACIRTSAPNVCGGTNTSSGTIACDGSCLASTPTTPAAPAYYGVVCSHSSAGAPTARYDCNDTCVAAYSSPS